MAAQQDWSHSGPEPRVEDMVHDPIVQLIMRRDRLTIAQTMAIITKARAQLRAAAAEPSGPGQVSYTLRPSS